MEGALGDFEEGLLIERELFMKLMQSPESAALRHAEIDTPCRDVGLPQQFYEAGVYENDYVRADGVWKIKRLDYMMQWQADFERGWSKTIAHLQPATQTYPANPLGPDVLLPPGQVRRTWPHRQDVPMHFAHPRFGALLASQA